ncbi:ParE family toxin-like protein [Candidatus Binatus sp.]|uniref:ParE family toxin-like protein n=1 Tax=Candidatus Binatus sp. TaxID=2811406 RepID=UPI003F9CCCDB
MRPLANQAYRQFVQDPLHPSLHFKQIHPTRPIWSVRIGIHYRAVGIKPHGSEIVWFWIGSHADYDKLI